jgi:hypothetical protein
MSLFSRHTGRRCRRAAGRGSFTGWAMASICPPVPVAEDFTRPRSAPVGLAPFPLAARDCLNPLEKR